MSNDLDEFEEGHDESEVMRVTIVRTADGERVEYAPDPESELLNPYTWRYRFLWEEGNFSCDCNRHLFFERARGVEPDVDDFQCSDGKYYVIVR